MRKRAGRLDCFGEELGVLLFTLCSFVLILLLVANRATAFLYYSKLIDRDAIFEILQLVIGSYAPRFQLSLIAATSSVDRLSGLPTCSR